MRSIDYYICFMFGDWFSSLVSQAGRSQARPARATAQHMLTFPFFAICAHTPRACMLASPQPSSGSEKRVISAYHWSLALDAPLHPTGH